MNSLGVYLGVSEYLYFINYYSPTKVLRVRTDDLQDAGTYTIFVTARAYDLSNIL